MLRTLLLNLILLLALDTHSQLFSLVNTRTQKTWDIDEYTIIYSAKQGPSGPVYYEYDVYRQRKYLSYAAYLYNNDSCQLLFRDRNALYIMFNLCNNTKQVLKYNKQMLDAALIDSITVRPFDSLLSVLHEYKKDFRIDTFNIKQFDSSYTRRLTTEQVRAFTAYWNKAKLYGFDRHPRKCNYVVSVYTKGKVRRLRVFFEIVAEENNWSYTTAIGNFFDRIWFGENATTVFDK